jgi:hypothetical protein
MMAIKAMFVTQDWHKSYGEALLEANPAKRPHAIALAEQGILDRYLEPLFRLPPDESLDLMNALDALSRLKKTTAAA